MRLGFLGPLGTFSEEAARFAARGDVFVPLPTVLDTILAVTLGDVERAVVPIENSSEGPVGVTLDTLADRDDVTIVGELVVPVHHCLVAGGPLALEDVRDVRSHPQAIAQCARFVRERLPEAEILETGSTAEAVMWVADAGDAGHAAIGTRRAAELYDARVLVEDIEDEPGNATRFVWIAPAGTAADSGAGGAKTSLAFWGYGDEAPGWLVRCLSEFAFRGVNLSKIESRPLRTRLGHYRFFVDCEGEIGAGPVAEAAEGLRAHCEEVRVLGSYPAAG